MRFAIGGIASLLLLLCQAPGLIGSVFATPTPSPAPTSSPSPTALSQKVDVYLTEFTIQPDVINASPGRVLELTLHNNGVVTHHWQIMGLTPRVEISSKGLATQVVKAPLVAGAYPFFCDIPGHREAGMQGFLVVK